MSIAAEGYDRRVSGTHCFRGLRYQSGEPRQSSSAAVQGLVGIGLELGQRRHPVLYSAAPGEDIMRVRGDAQHQRVYGLGRLRRALGRLHGIRG